jgi:outer membrane immunogenic protein
VADRTLIYATGGWAFADVHVRNNGLVTGPLSYGSTRNGWTLGAGAEYAFADNVIGRFEYRYSNFGSDSVVAAATSTCTPFAPAWRSSSDQKH